MKKTLCFIVVFVFCLAGVGCKDDLEKYDKYISEIRDSCFEGESERFTLSAISGERESDFCIDGVSKERKEFLLVTLSPKVKENCVYSYCMNINDKEYKGNFDKHPYNNSFSCEVDVHNYEDFSLTITDNNGKSESAKLVNVGGEGEISATHALEIAMKKLVFDKTRQEIFIRKFKNPTSSEGMYYWYVAFCSADKKVNALLLDIHSGGVVALRED